MAITTYIDETIIDNQLQELENEAFGQQWMQNFLEKEPILASFLFSEDVKILVEEEKSLFSFLIIAVWSATAKNYESAQCTPEDIEELEEKNWEVFMGTKGDFRTKLNTFFDSFAQEDLLALIEDLLEDDSADAVELTKEGKEFIFIKTKTLLDVLMMPAH